MPIDFKQVAAPSFSDSNTLVALAAKQQQEAMTGIQGAWTGAMDAIGNRVQGEMEGIANQASFSQLTDPTQRAALEQEIMAANTLGMGNVRDINKYVDERRGVQLGLIDNVNRVDTAAQVEADRVRDRTISDASWFLVDTNSQIEAEEDEEKRALLQESAKQRLNAFGLTDTELAKANQFAVQHGQENTLTELEILTKMYGPEAAEAAINATNQGITSSKIGDAIAVDKHNNGGKGDALASKRKYADSLGLQGAYDKDGKVQYNVLMQKVTDTIAKSAQEQERVDPETMSYDEYLVKNNDLMEKTLGTFGRKTNVRGLQAHFGWAANNGAPYSDRDKILITEGFLTGSIKLGLFTDNFFDGIKDDANNKRIGQAIAKTHLPQVETEFNTKRMQAGQDAFGPLIDFFRSENIPPDQALINLGITSTDHPQAKYLPENYRKVLEAMVTQPPPDGAPPLLSQAQKDAAQAKRMSIPETLNDLTRGTNAPGSGVLANTTGGLDAAQTERMSIPANLDNLTRGATAGSGVLANTQDLAAVGKANNVGTASPASSKTKPVNKVTNNGYVIPENARTITGKNGSTQYEYLPITTSVAKDLGVKINSRGELVLPANRKNETAYDVYGGKWKLTDADTYEQLLGINNSAQAKDKIKKGNAFIKGTSNYRPPQRRLKTPDPKHPLAHLLSDDPKNFVPYNERNPDGSPIHISKVEKKKYGKFRYTDAHTNFSK